MWLFWIWLLTIHNDLQIILKHCRETHCHFCFNELPADSIPCSSCTIPVYCSQHCQERAGGVRSWGNQHSDTKFENIAVDLQKYVASINLSGGTEVDANLGAIGKEIAEHRHECGGIHWPAVLPPEIVLAGRILAKSIETRRCLGEAFTHVEDLVILWLPFFIISIICIFWGDYRNCSNLTSWDLHALIGHSIQLVPLFQKNPGYWYDGLHYRWRISQ